MPTLRLRTKQAGIRCDLERGPFSDVCFFGFHDFHGDHKQGEGSRPYFWDGHGKRLDGIPDFDHCRNGLMTVNLIATEPGCVLVETPDGEVSWVHAWKLRTLPEDRSTWIKIHCDMPYMVDGPEREDMMNGGWGFED